MLIYSAYQQYGVIILWLDWYYLEELPLYNDTLTAKKKCFFIASRKRPCPGARRPWWDGDWLARGAASDLHVEKQILNKLNNLTKNKLSNKPAVGCNSMIFLPSLSFCYCIFVGLGPQTKPWRINFRSRWWGVGQRPRPVYRKTDLEKVENGPEVRSI